MQQTRAAYAKRSKKEGTKKLVAMRLSPRTIAGVEYLRESFGKRYPKSKFPTVSAVMSDFIQARVALFEFRPSVLNAEIKEFKEKYGAL